MSSLTAGILPSSPVRRARDLVAIGGVVAGAALAGVLLFHGPLLVAIGFCLLPLVVWMLGRPGPALLLLGASIPITYSLTGGGGGFNLSPSDLLLLFVGAAIVFEAVVTDSLPSVAALGPVRKAVGQ
jgi:hypothetical protein